MSTARGTSDRFRSCNSRDDDVARAMTLTLAVLGDSIAYGQGATNQRDTVGARLEVMLGAAGIATEVKVFAVPGSRSEALAPQVERATRVRPQVALIIIGANDLTHFVPPVVAADQLGAAITALTAAGTKVVVAPAPDMSALPGVPAQLKPLVRAASATLQQAQTRVAQAAGARVVDLSGGLARFASDPTLLSRDRFHPSSAGYAVIAGAVGPAVLAAALEVAERGA